MEYESTPIDSRYSCGILIRARHWRAGSGTESFVTRYEVRDPTQEVLHGLL